MSKIVRTKTKVTGGITVSEKARMAEHAKKWIGIAMRTDPIEPEKIVPPIRRGAWRIDNPVKRKASPAKMWP